MGLDWVVEERREARKRVARLLGEEAAKLVEELPDARAFGGSILFYVPPGCISCIDTERLVKAFELILGEKPQVTKKAGTYDVRVIARSKSYVLGIQCIYDYKGCQAELRAKNTGALVDCKMQCYGQDNKLAVAAALILAYARVPAEYAHPYWGAKTG
ncbi:hypothetical protein PABY_21600 [Pyrodictium abyssi]|uniref:Uncharacterized protein n=2 Tax=Pyrodictium abyssi TaxID=54256 RepID=A0ABM8IZU8_9CREN|nr:hypothetical protein PABY_21600 [Pyrodictium abyssi]